MLILFMVIFLLFEDTFKYSYLCIAQEKSLMLFVVFVSLFSIKAFSRVLKYVSSFWKKTIT